MAQEYEVLKEMDKAKDKRIRNLEKELAIAQKELELERRENELNQKIQEVMKQEIAAKDRAFQDMKEIADRSIKLAETSGKKSGNWQLTGLLGAAAMVIGFLLAK